MLVKFQWDEQYNVSVDAFNNQHKRFFEIYNSIVDYINSETHDKEVLKDYIDKLIGYSFYHLSFEEEYFNKYRYKDRINHKDSHDAFRSKVQDLRNKIEDPEVDVDNLGGALAQFSSDWLQQHILNVDAKYSDFFKDKNIEETDNLAF